MLDPTILIIFGATGDLVNKKILPSIYNLYKEKKLPEKFKVIAFARRDFTDGKYNEIVKESLHHYGNLEENEDLSEFMKLFQYHQGNFDDLSALQSLGEELKKIDNDSGVSNKLFYLAVPPTYYQELFNNIHESKVHEQGGTSRIIVEKPFGSNLETAQQLDELLGKLFKEEQIFRIDHYLGKEALQNILTFRFSNLIFEPIWSNKYIERIEIRTLESMGVETRGEFYDKVGALRDVGQNHLLQMVALITMENPEGKDIRETRASLLEKLIPLTDEDVKNKTYRAQYEGYKEIDKVDPGSKTETYFRLSCGLNSERWSGVEIVLEAGKKLASASKEIIVFFKPVGNNIRNKIIFSIEPTEEIKIKFLSNESGDKNIKSEQSLDFNFRANTEKKQYVEEYAQLFLDAINGDMMSFISSKEVNAMWKFIDSIKDGWNKDLVPLNTYKPGETVVIDGTNYKL
ncbi:MAG: glucose-6-phosphate dehydrogenase [Candidatus Dojkabacteria bacterium]